MRPFSERLKEAARHARVDFSQAAIAKSLGIKRRQTVDRWMGDGTPAAEMIFHIADKWGVDARWLATDQGEMVPKPGGDGLDELEADLVQRYRSADQRWQLSLRLLSYVATEKQNEIAGMVNVIIARAFGKEPRDIRPVASVKVHKAYGDAPHVAARKRAKEAK